MGIDYVDGRRYARAVVAGAEWVRHTREALNRINVFPVADGDTGTNMALSLAATASAVRGLEERHLGRVCERVAEASILGAKGNSGLILAHWFLGIARSVGGHARVEAGGLAEAIRAGSDSVYAAIEKPVEGTILTVMRSASEAAAASVERGRNVQALLDDTIQEAEEALARTPELLKALAQAGVVDAGAAGWVNFMRGVRRSIRGEPAPVYRAEVPTAPAHPPIGEDEEITERYCTELICRGHGFDAAKLKRTFHDDGSFLLVATSGNVFKLHIHTNHPDVVFKKAAKLGTVEERKVDDMLRQRDERGAGETGAGLAAQPDTVAVLCDSTADLPEALREESGIGLVPLQVLFGDEVFRDQVDLRSAEFYERLGRGETPRTSQPAPRAFVEALERVRPDRPTVVLTLSRKLSGTWRSATSGAELATDRQVRVVDTRTTSLGLGLLALGAARLAERGAGLEEVVRWVERWREGTGIAFTVATLEYLRRGGRIGAAASLVGTLLGLRPVLTFEGKDVVAAAKVRGDRRAFEGVLAEVARRVPDGSRVRFGVIEQGRPQEAEEAEQRLRERYDIVDLIRGEFTGVVGAHTGPGTWGVIWQRVPDDDPLAGPLGAAGP